MPIMTLCFKDRSVWYLYPLHFWFQGLLPQYILPIASMFPGSIFNTFQESEMYSAKFWPKKSYFFKKIIKNSKSCEIRQKIIENPYNYRKIDIWCTGTLPDNTQMV